MPNIKEESLIRWVMKSYFNVSRIQKGFQKAVDKNRPKRLKIAKPTLTSLVHQMAQRIFHQVTLRILLFQRTWTDLNHPLSWVTVPIWCSTGKQESISTVVTKTQWQHFSTPIKINEIAPASKTALSKIPHPSNKLSRWLPLSTRSRRWRREHRTSSFQSPTRSSPWFKERTWPLKMRWWCLTKRRQLYLTTTIINRLIRRLILLIRINWTSSKDLLFWKGWGRKLSHKWIQYINRMEGMHSISARISQGY